MFWCAAPRQSSTLGVCEESHSIYVKLGGSFVFVGGGLLLGSPETLDLVPAQAMLVSIRIFLLDDFHWAEQCLLTCPFFHIGSRQPKICKSCWPVQI
jgi:hypothetical protein